MIFSILIQRLLLLNFHIYLLFNRPSFDILEVWLENLAKHLSTNQLIPADLRYDIEHFKESIPFDKLHSPQPSTQKSDFIVNELFNSCMEKSSSPSTKLDIEDSGPSSILDVQMLEQRSTDVSNPHITSNPICCIATKNLCSAKNQALVSLFDNNHHNHNNSLHNSNEKLIDTVPSSSENEANSTSLLREIAKSPHLCKDFSPNGERLRNSIRVRRQERLQKQRSLRSLASLLSQQSSCSWDSGNENSATPTIIDDIDVKSSERIPSHFNYSKLNLLTQTVKKSKPYGEKGFIIHVNDGSLTLNDVKDLNNCYSDDFDSSCDTSLNYIDPDSISLTADTENIHQQSIPSSLASPQIIAHDLNSSDETVNGMNRTLDKVREDLIKCKTKLSALELVDAKLVKRLPKANQPMKKARDQAQIVAVATKQPNLSVFTRLHPVSSPVLNSRAANGKQTTKTQNFDNPKKFTNKRIDAIQNGANNKSNMKNYSKNTIAFIEKINDSDRHLKPLPDDRKNANRKSNINNKFGSQRSNGVDDVCTEIVTRKPPASNSPKKRNDCSKSTAKKANNVSPTRKRL